MHTVHAKSRPRRCACTARHMRAHTNTSAHHSRSPSQIQRNGRTDRHPRAQKSAPAPEPMSTSICKRERAKTPACANLRRATPDRDTGRLLHRHRRLRRRRRRPQRVGHSFPAIDSDTRLLGAGAHKQLLPVMLFGVHAHAIAQAHNQASLTLAKPAPRARIQRTGGQA